MNDEQMHMDAEPFEPACEICGSDLWWEPCDQCGGEGFREVYEDDPMWYDEDDTETCDWCLGHGGHYFCLNTKAHGEPAP